MLAHEKGTALVAEPDDVFGEELVGRFRSAGFRCERVSDGHEARRALKDGDFELLLAEIHMSGNADLELVRWTRGEFGGLPIALLTGRPSLQTAVEAVQLSVAAYVAKPPQWDDLLAMAVKEIARYRAHLRFKAEEKNLAACVEALEKELNTVIAQEKGCEGSEEIRAGVRALIRRVGPVVEGAREIVPELQTEQSRDRFSLSDLEAALAHTIEVLEMTRHQFKSKELGKLRRHLERILQGRKEPLS